MTIHDVRFMDRDVFYRLSLSEMFVPYGDPRNPIYRKGAFDLGNVGAGVTANNLSCEMSFCLKPFLPWLLSDHGS
jgi:primary-amine oxidase